jgi:hypothetical protein
MVTMVMTVMTCGDSGGDSGGDSVTVCGDRGGDNVWCQCDRV